VEYGVSCEGRRISASSKIKIKRTYRRLINLCYVDETIERKGFPCSWEWSVWGGWVQTLFAV
jgi:hypothetical protein